MARIRLIAGMLVIIATVWVPVAEARSTPLGLVLPKQVDPGLTTAIEFRMPRGVGAVDGRLLFDTSALEAVGIAPVGGGTAFAPVPVDGGVAFGAYGLMPNSGRTAVRLVVVPLVTGRIGVRVVIDAAANQAGRRLNLARRAGSATLFSGSGSTYSAPAAGPSPTPARAGGATRTVTGHVTLVVQDLDVARAAWEEARLNDAVCGTLLDGVADANGDGCVDIVDVQAVAADQHDTAAANPSVATVSAQTLANAPHQRNTAASSGAAAALAYTATFTVTSTSDTADANPGDRVCADSQGRCTLRAAITETNWSNGPDLIQFNINASAPVRITLTNFLPHLMDRTGGVTIDGYSQPGSRVNSAQYGSNAIPGIELVGTASSPRTNIFYIKSAGNVVRGLALNNAYRPIAIQGADAHDNRIVGNWIGFTGSGALGSYNLESGVYIDADATANVIGTPDAADRNVIGNGTKAIFLYGPGNARNVIQNNVMCMSPSGARATCSSAIDHDFGPKDGLIGGTGPNERNVMGPTLLNGVEYSHGWEPGTQSNDVVTWQLNDNRVIGNWIGFRIDGHYDANYRSGLNNPGSADNGNGVNVYDGAHNNLIEGNWIASAYDGVNTMYANATGNIIRYNVIGESPLGEPAPMAWWGVHVRYSTTDHQIIGNTIRNATRGGVGLAIPPNGSAGGERRILISRNIITDTTGPAIYLTPISSGSAAPGSNNLFPSPVITSATTVLVSGTGVAGSTVEVYRASRPAGQSGLPVAFLGSGTVAGDGTWSVPVTVTSGDQVTALEIATNNNTSMLGTNVTATYQAPPPAPPTADFSWAQQPNTMIVAFTDASTGSPTAWTWDFGDGGSSTDQSPNHTYATSGDYTVSLTASNGGGPSTEAETIHVAAAAGNPDIVVDGFGRTVGSSWGSADIGGIYSLFDTAADYSVAGGVGKITVPKKGNTRRATLNGVSAHDVDIVVRVSIDKLPAGGAQYIYAVGRSSGNNGYQPKIILNTNGTVAVHAGVRVSNSESSLGPPVTVPGLNPSAGESIWLHARITGSNPTTIQVRAWADGQPEPAAWQFTATNSAAALQSSGGVGLAAYIGGSATNAPVTVSFDDYTVSDPNDGAPQAPNAEFTWSQQPNSLSVDFSDSSTGAPTSWAWDFGDGTSSTERNPTKTFAEAGAYPVKLTVSNAAGQTSITHLVGVSATGAGTIYVEDTFSRTVTAGWGTADTGGLWTPTGTAALNVVDGLGMITPPRAISTRSAELNGAAARDVDVTFRVALDRVPIGGTVWVYAAVRRNGDDEYRPKLLFYANGTVAIHASQVVADVESPISSPVTVPGLTYGAAQFVRVHMRVTGSGPTTLSVNAWADGQPEPAGWQYNHNNSNSALQGQGSVALRVHDGSGMSNAPVSALFDDYTVSEPTTAPPVTTTATLVGAGDIAVCDSNADSDTAAVVAGITGTVFTAGDNAYPDGSLSDYQSCYEPSWGAFKDRTRPVPGNHEFQTPGAAGYFAYFGGAAGPPGRGYYAFDAGAWRVYALNSECASNGTCTDQYDWLAADIAAAPHVCSMAIWHRPRFSSGPHGGANNMATLFTLLYDRGVELLISGHDHLYERLTPADGDGVADAARGVRQFVVGTGGSGLYAPSTTLDLVEVENHETHGVLRLDLAPDSYTWTFLPSGTGTFTDSGSTTCH